MLATVQNVCSDGKHGPFAFATTCIGKKRTITFSLLSPVWTEDIYPEEGHRVILESITRKEAGWKADKARFQRLEDEKK